MNLQYQCLTNYNRKQSTAGLLNVGTKVERLMCAKNRKLHFGVERPSDTEWVRKSLMWGREGERVRHQEWCEGQVRNVPTLLRLVDLDLSILNGGQVKG